MLKRFLGFVVVGTLLLGFGWLFHLNPAQIELHVTPSKTYTLPLPLLVLGSFLAGASAIFLLALVREAQWTLSDRRRRRIEGKKAKGRALVAAGRDQLWHGHPERAKRLLRRASVGRPARRVRARATRPAGAQSGIRTGGDRARRYLAPSRSIAGGGIGMAAHRPPTARARAAHAHRVALSGARSADQGVDPLSELSRAAARSRRGSHPLSARRGRNRRSRRRARPRRSEPARAQPRAAPR